MPRPVDDPRGVEDGRGTADRGLAPPPGPLYAQAGPGVPAPAKTAGAQKKAAQHPDRSPIHFSVEPIKQPNWAACWPTAMLTLLHWRDSRRHQTVKRPELDAMVFPKTKGGVQKMVAMNEVPGFIAKYKIEKDNILLDPETFRRALGAHNAPFAYMSDLEPWQHMLIITGIEFDRDVATLRYIDPDKGRELRDEFYAFVLKHKPYPSNKWVDIYIADPKSSDAAKK